MLVWPFSVLIVGGAFLDYWTTRRGYLLGLGSEANPVFRHALQGRVKPRTFALAQLAFKITLAGFILWANPFGAWFPPLIVVAVLVPGVWNVLVLLRRSA